MAFKCENNRENWRGTKDEIEQVMKKRGIPEGIIRGVKDALSSGFGEEQERLDRAMLQAASEGDKHRIVGLLADDADISACNEDRCTPLHLAAEKGHADVVKLLIDKGADVNVESFNGRTPIFYAVENGHALIVWMLHEMGANLNARDGEQSTLLHEAVISFHPSAEIVRFFIQNGADVNAKDKHGNTPLDLAKKVSIEESIQKLLIDAGAEESEEVPF